MLDMRGVFTATVTPFDEMGEINLAYVASHLRFQENHGIRGVVPCGTNGEGQSLSLEERKRLIEHVVRHKGSMLVVAGTGCVSLTETIELTRFAESAGADAALILPPFFIKDPTQQGLLDYFRRVFDSVSLPILLYNIPSFTSVEISDELIAGLSGHPHLYGVKDSSGDFSRLERYVRSFPQLRIFVGRDVLVERALRAGAAGAISGETNVVPEVLAGLYQQFTSGEDTSAAQCKASRYAEMFASYPPRAGTKYALALRGFPESRVRPPLVELTEEQKVSLLKELEEEGFPIGEM